MIPENEVLANDELVSWISYIGGAFTSSSAVRADFVELVRRNATANRSTSLSWLVLRQVMQRYIWSDRAFEHAVKNFWREAAAPQIHHVHV